jgi:hypothetical protein
MMSMQVPNSIFKKKNVANRKAITFVNDSKQMRVTLTKKQQSADPLVFPSAAFQRRKLQHLKPQFNLLLYFGG